MSAEELAGLIAGAFGVGTALMTLVLYALMVVANWRLFTMAGKEGWLSLIPIVNTWVTFDIVYGAGWKFLLSAIPFVGFLVPLIFYVRFAQVYGRSLPFGIGMIFLSPILMLVMAFDGQSHYSGPIKSFL